MLEVRHHDFLASDHRSIIVDWRAESEVIENGYRGRRLHHFEDSWYSVGECKEIIKRFGLSRVKRME